MGAERAVAQSAPKFPIVRFQVEGNTLLPQDEIEAIVAPFVGPGRDFGDVQGALEALEAKYREHGYTTVSVLLPEQVLEKGDVRLNVIEGRIRELKIDGQLHFDIENIRASLPTLRVGEVPLIDEVSANLRVANENPAKNVALRLKPGEQDEDIDAYIKVSDEVPWKVGITLENTGTDQTGSNRLGFSFQHANLWNRDHVLTAQYQTSPEKPEDVKVYALAYRMPLYGLGDALDFYATRSNVNAGSIAAGPISLAISGSGVVYGARYTMNLKRRDDYEQQVVFGIDHKAFENNIGGGGLQLGNDITVHPLSLQYNGHWTKDRSDFSLFGSLSRNIPGGDKGGQADFQRVRVGAPDDFSVLRGGFAVSHAYESDWQVRVNGSAQWTDSPLIPGEQFGIGGSGSVRGFLEREIADDKGMQTSVEVYTPELCRPLGGDHHCRALAFVDAGAVYRVSPLPNEPVREHIASAGLGLRYSLGKSLAFQTDYGRVIQGGGNRDSGDWRIHARLGIFF
jgi:hemolysin activation/secretion protein